MLPKNTFTFLAVGVAAITLAACGGGGESDSSENSDDGATASTPNDGGSSNMLPTADAGSDQTVDQQANVTLAGSGTDPDGTIVSYRWEQTSGDSVSLSNADAATASFTAPNVDSETSLEFKLTVTDNQGVSLSDSVVITVMPSISPPAVLANLQATAGNERIDLSWEAVAGATSYTLYYAEESFNSIDSHQNYASLAGGTMIASIPADTYTLAGLSNGTTYYMVVSAQHDSGEGEVSHEVSATPEAPVAAGVPPNDTGIMWGGDYPSGNNSDCSGEAVGQQDCAHGRDATHNDDSDGHAGFSFTKLDADGNDLPASASEWHCVKDNVSGLIWEMKTNDGGLHDGSWTYSWYSSDSASNGGVLGSENGGSCFDGIHCDTEKFVEQVNLNGLCGASDWRLPTVDELLSIVDNSGVAPAIDSAYFPNAKSDWYWSATPPAYNPDEVWRVNFFDGRANSSSRSDATLLRLLRGGQ